jgi:dTMP kinase
MMTGKFISIEGTEGAGKSTALKFIREYLEKKNLAVTWTREPGGTDLAEKIRALLLHPECAEIMTSETELLLMFAGRAQHIQRRIVPELQAGRWVVSDRFIDASYAYQAGGRGLDIHKIEMLDEWIVGAHYPDLTILLDIAPEQGFARAAKRGTDHDRIEQEKIDFFIRVRETYLQRAKQYSQRIKTIDASGTIAAVQSQIQHVLDDFIARQTT